MVSITKNNIERFRKSYEAAITVGAEVFVFDGAEVLTQYVKYVLEYFDGRKTDERRN